MRICLLTENISSIGGVQRVVTRLANELGKYHEVTIVSTLDPLHKSPAYDLDTNIKLEMNHNLMKASLLSRIFRTSIKLFNTKTNMLNNDYAYSLMEKVYYPQKFKKNFINYIKTNQFDVVIGVEGYLSVLLGIIHDQIECKVIGWQHNAYEAYFQNKNRYYWNQDVMFKINIPKLNDYIVLTQHDQKLLQDYFNISSKVIYNPISFTSLKKSNVENKTIIGLGRFTPQKGFDQLIEAFSLIAAQYKEWTINLYGSGTDEEKLKNLIHKYQLQNQVFLHSTTNNVENILLESSIYAMSSRWEGFGLVVTEALECGVPVVAFNTTGPAEILSDYQCGILVEQGDIKGFSQALETLIKDEQIRNQLSRNAITRAKEFYPEQIVNHWLEIIES